MNHRLRYSHPANLWKEAFPMGNGRMGVMFYGKPGREVLDLSEITCFSGEASAENNTEGAPEAFLDARKALLNGDFKAAKAHIDRYIPERLNYGTNLPLGHLILETAGCDWEASGFRQDPPQENSTGEGKVSGYRRSLTLDTAVAEAAWEAAGARYGRTAFVSNPHQVFVMRLTSDNPGGMELQLSMDGDGNPYRVVTDGKQDLLLYGNAWESMHSDGRTGVRFHARLHAEAPEGTVTAAGQGLRVSSAGEVLLFLAAATDFGGLDAEAWCRGKVEAASALSFDELMETHSRDFLQLFGRVELTLGEETFADGTESSAADVLPDVTTDVLLEQVKAGRDVPAFSALMFQYGRYLLISASRENSPLPAHLQGVWNDSVASRIGWTCDMHLDINTQMNYWPAEVTNLPECHQPLFNWIENGLVPSGRITARKAYGLKGWVAELVSNAWSFTAPYWHGNLSPCPTGGVWAASHMWEHYLFTGDRKFLKNRAWPVLKEAVEFFADYIFEDPSTGCLTCGPSISPENSFVVDGETYTNSLGPTYEIVMIRELFSMFMEACRVLQINDELLPRVQASIGRLLPFRTGPEGEILEWSHDYPSADPQHRHTSHLLSLFPYSRITPEKTPELAKAAKRCLELKMLPPESWEDTGWARSMLMLYSARLQEKEEAWRHIQAMLRHLTNPNLMVRHPPTRGAPSFADVYELDGNTGLTSCIAELLLQSHDGELKLLPVLPDGWASGHVKGLCGRGGFEVEMTWENGQLCEAVLYSKLDTLCNLRYGNIKKSLQLAAGGTYRLNARLELA